jgi:hypothetical protein
MTYRIYTIIVLALAIGLYSCTHEPVIIPEPDPPEEPGGGDTSNCHADTIYFVNNVLPLLVSSCGVVGCHDPGTAADGIILTDYQNIINSDVITPSDPGDSELYEKITETDPDKIMPPPPRAPLSQEQIDKIGKWIRQGALNNECVETACDTANVSFNDDVWPLIQTNCLGCHSESNPSAGISLADHASITVTANNGSLLGTITHTPGYSPMPKNGNKLSDCNIAKIQKWINDGTPDN